MEIESDNAENGEFKMRDRLLNGQHRVTPTSHDVEFIDAIKEVIRRFGPSCLAFQDNIILLINFLFIGMLDDPLAISACGLAVFTTDITIVSIGKGLCCGIDTLVSQAYGRNDYTMCRIYLNIARSCIGVFAIIQLLIVIFAESIYSLLGQPNESAVQASDYLLIVYPGFILLMLYECNRRYQIALGNYFPICIINVTCIIQHIISLLITVKGLELGLTGVAISSSVTYCLYFFILESYSFTRTETFLKAEWMLIETDLITYIIEFVRYGVFGIFMFVLSWWPMEILTMYSGWTGQIQLSVNSILSNMSFFFTDIVNGLGMVATSLVGNSLGENRGQKAKTYAKATLCISLTIGFIILIAFLLFGNHLIYLYTDNLEQIDTFNDVRFPFTIDLFNCLIFVSLDGTLCAMGYQKYTTGLIVLLYWIVGLPLSYLIAFPFNRGYIGMWYCIPIASFALMSSYIAMILCAPWNILAFKASSHEQSEMSA